MPQKKHIAENYHYLITKIANRYAAQCPPWMDTDDLISEAYAEIFRRLDDYDPDKAALSTFLQGIIHGTMSHVIRDTQNPETSFPSDENGTFEPETPVSFRERLSRTLGPDARDMLASIITGPMSRIIDNARGGEAARRLLKNHMYATRQWDKKQFDTVYNEIKAVMAEL